MRARRRLYLGLTGLVVAGGVAGAAYLAADDGAEPAHHEAESGGSGAGLEVVVHRSPACGCCKTYEEYLRRHDYEVESVVAEDVSPVKADHGVPVEAESCHTSVIDGYAVEGHVPVEAIEKLLDERPAIDGIAVAGMPANSPGMGEPDGKPLTVVAFDDGRVDAFLTL